MKQIEAMTEQEKSVILARLCGWLKTDEYFYSYFPPFGQGVSVNRTKGYVETDIFDTKKLHGCRTLYHVLSMPLAWYVLNWAMSNLDKEDYDYQMSRFIEFSEFETMPPQEAQRLWLDKILNLALETGMINDIK